MNMEGDIDNEVAWNALTYTSDRRASPHLSLVIHSTPCKRTSVMLTILFANYLSVFQLSITHPSN